MHDSYFPDITALIAPRSTLPDITALIAPRSALPDITALIAPALDLAGHHRIELAAVNTAG